MEEELKDNVNYLDTTISATNDILIEIKKEMQIQTMVMRDLVEAIKWLK